MIYFARCGHDGPIKIGHTIGGIASRISFLQVGCPWQIIVLGTMDGDLKTESSLLKRFSHLNMRGEWFHASNELLAFIEENASPDERKPVVRHVRLFSVNSLDDEDWPAIIARIMDIKGWNQCDMAAALGVHQAMISKWKSGRHGPSKPARILMRTMLSEATAEKSVLPENAAFLAEIDEFLSETGMANSYFSKVAAGNGEFLTRLRAGKRMWPETIEKVRAFMKQKREAA